MRTSVFSRRFQTRFPKPRRGSVLILTAFGIILMMGLLALSVDMGYIFTTKTQLKRTVDAAALAATLELSDGDAAAQELVVEYIVRNPSSGPMQVITDLDAVKADWLDNHEDDLEITFGYWNPETKQLDPSSKPSAIKVAVADADVPLFFARALGHHSVNIQVSSTATYRPRDIVLVLDLSGSMNDDSEFKSIGSLGRVTVENNLEDIYTELGSPQYGNMSLPPEYVTVIGVPPTSGSLPQITVEYRGNELYVTSTKDISNIVLEFEDGSTFRDESFSDGDLTTTMTMGQTIARAWVKSGTNDSGYGPGYGELFDFTDDYTFINALDLTTVPYPYPSGSWSEYINHVKSPDFPNATSAGYRFKFGYLNLVNYWLEKQPAYNQTPDLWKVSARPLSTVKEAVDLFADYVGEVNTTDRIALAVYNSASGEGTVEVPLSYDLNDAVNGANSRQAGHYHSMTNIGAGLAAANNELLANGRDGAFKMIVVLTDGVANWYAGSNDTNAAANYTISEAGRAHDLKHKVMTISLGLGADTLLMSQVADIADGYHFNVPGGLTVNQTAEGLISAFQEIARKRPVMLVE